jgi:hypothetical protein
MSEPDIRCEWSEGNPTQCVRQATVIARWCYRHLTRAMCDVHAPEMNNDGPTDRIIRDPRVVSILCAGLSGWLPAAARDLVAAVCADPAAVPVLLDFAEVQGEWRRVDVEWPRVERHEHRWMAYESGVPTDGDRHAFLIEHGARRCPCGVFEHELLHDRERRIAALADRIGNDRLFLRPLPFEARDQHDDIGIEMRFPFHVAMSRGPIDPA